MYGPGECGGHVLERAVIETLESRRLLSLVAESGTNFEASIDPEDPNVTKVDVNVEDLEEGSAPEIRYTLSLADGGPVDGGEVVDGDYEVTMVTDDGGSPCPEEADENGDPLYCIMETGVTPAPLPTLVNGLLNVTGTAGNDKVRIGIAKDPTKLAVKVNGRTTLFAVASGISSIKVDGLAGDDFICIKQNRGSLPIPAELIGGEGDDKICGGDGNDLISGGAGKDKLRGNAGDDVLAGGDGNDNLFGGIGNDSVLGGNGDDKIRGGRGNDNVDGNGGKDKIRGGVGNDNCLDEDGMMDADVFETSSR